MVPRAQAHQRAYSMLVLVQCDVDHARLTSAARECRAKINGLKGRLWEGRIAELSRAADLCEQAAKMVEDAGGVSDDRARRRLLAGCEYRTMVMTLGSAVPAVAQSSAETMCRALEAIDEEP